MEKRIHCVLRRQGGSPEVSDEALAAEKAKRHVAEPGYMRDEGRVAPFALEASAFHKVTARVPKERAMFSGDALSYEELGRLYHSSKRAKDVLFRLFFKMAAGRIHDSLRPLLGDCFLVGLRKPDGGTRPIGIGSALRRLTDNPREGWEDGTPPPHVPSVKKERKQTTQGRDGRTCPRECCCKILFRIRLCLRPPTRRSRSPPAPDSQPAPHWCGRGTSG